MEIRLISGDSELEKGKKRGLEGVQPPPQQRRQGTARVSSVPPGSSTAKARERAAAMVPKPPSGRGTGKVWQFTVTGKLPPDFNPVSSIKAYGNTPIEERKKKIFHKTMYEKAWHTLQGMLAALGTSEDNVPAFECTFLHWFNCMETNPMNISMEAILEKLFEVDRDAYFADLDQDAPEDVTTLHKAIIVDSLTNVKNFMSSFGVSVRDFFDQDKSRFSLQPSRGGKGGKGDQYPPLTGKASGKSTNRPKEPTPLSKKGGIIQLDKPLVQPSVPLVLHKPPTKAELSTPVVEHPATPKPGVETGVAAESVPKTEPAVVEQSKPKEEAVVSADPPKAKAEMEVVAQDIPKAKAEAVVQQPQAKTEVKTAEKAGQPKSEDKSQSLLSLAGIKGALGFGTSKPERPPPVSQGHDMTQLEQDEEADLNAAIQASMQAPTSPQVPSGAQSSMSMPTNLDDRESELMTKLDKLSAEALRLEVITNPSIREQSRMRTIEGVTEEIVQQLGEIAQQRLRSTSSASVSQASKVQPAKPIAAPPVVHSPAPSTSVKAVSPHTQQPLTIERLLRGMSGQQDPGTGTGGPLPLVSVDVAGPQPTTPTVKASEPTPVRSRERTPVRRSRSATPTQEVQLPFPAIEDGPPPMSEVKSEFPKERERTPRKERTQEKKKKKRRSPSTSRDRSPKERQRSPTPVKDRSHRSKKRTPSPTEERRRSETPPRERSHRRRRHSPSLERTRSSEEHRRSSTSAREHRHDRRRRSPTPKHDRVSEDRRRSPSHSRDPSGERRRRRRSPESSEVSRDERRRSPSPKVVPDSPKVSSKKSKKSEKKEKKASKSSRRTEAVETVEDKPIRDERSRSVRRPEPSRAQPLQDLSLEDTELDDHPPKDDRPEATHDRPVRPRPRFDPSREYASAQRVMERRKVVQPPREHERDPGTDGPPDIEAEAKQRRKYPPPPPPASSMRQTQTSHRSLAFANPPPRRDSATESSRVSERQPLRIRSQETPPQRPMPKRVVATSTVGSSAPPRLQDTSGRTSRGDYYDQSRLRDDRTYGQQPQQDRQEWGSSQGRVPSMGRRESLHAWAGHQHSSQYYQDWSQQQPSTQEYWHDPQQGHQQHYPQQWHEQQQQQMQQQLPALPNPVYPPGMQQNVQPPPGLGSNVQRTRQGVMTQGASMQYGSAVSRQQSPSGSQPPQDRHQSSYSQQYPFTSGYFRQGYQ